MWVCLEIIDQITLSYLFFIQFVLTFDISFSLGGSAVTLQKFEAVINDNGL